MPDLRRATVWVPQTSMRRTCRGSRAAVSATRRTSSCASARSAEGSAVIALDLAQQGQPRAGLVVVEGLQREAGVDEHVVADRGSSSRDTSTSSVPCPCPDQGPAAVEEADDFQRHGETHGVHHRSRGSGRRQVRVRRPRYVPGRR